MLNPIWLGPVVRVQAVVSGRNGVFMQRWNRRLQVFVSYSTKPQRIKILED